MIKPFVIRITHVRFFRCDNLVSFGLCGNLGEGPGVIGVLDIPGPSFDVLFPFVLFLEIKIVVEEPSDEVNVKYDKVDNAHKE